MGRRPVRLTAGFLCACWEQETLEAGQRGKASAALSLFGLLDVRRTSGWKERRLRLDTEVGVWGRPPGTSSAGTSSGLISVCLRSGVPGLSLEGVLVRGPAGGPGDLGCFALTIAAPRHKKGPLMPAARCHPQAEQWFSLTAQARGTGLGASLPHVFASLQAPISQPLPLGVSRPCGCRPALSSLKELGVRQERAGKTSLGFPAAQGKEQKARPSPAIEK